MKKLILLAALTMGATSSAQETPSAKLAVHEWGTFTTVAGADGASLEWRPLAGPSDLPNFVYQIGGAPKGLRHGTPCKACHHYTCGCGENCKPDKDGHCHCCKSCIEASVRMETPVLYFYSDKETTVSVDVKFPKGRITEWYPHAREVGAGITWGGVKVVPGGKFQFPMEKAESHYYPARETDAAPLQVCGEMEKSEHEKFLFYRGVGTFDLPVSVTLKDGRVTVKNVGREPVLRIMLLRVKEGRLSHVWMQSDDKMVPSPLKPGATWETPLPEKEDTRSDMATWMEQALVGEGLYNREAHAMVKTWEGTWFNDEGLRVFYIVPRKVTDGILPITIDPKPSEMVRVLVGRVEILTPEMESAIRSAVEKLGDNSIEARDRATQTLKKFGRFAEPILKRVLASTSDEEVKTRIRELMSGL